MTRRLEVPRIIPAIRRGEEQHELPDARQTNAWVFVLGGPLDEVAVTTALLQKRGWLVFVHVDMVRGLFADGEGIRFFAEYAGPAGIISTHSSAISHAKRAGLVTVQRIFLLDSQSIATGVQQVLATRPDAVEILPGILFEAGRRIAQQVPCPVIAGGLVSKPEEVATMTSGGVRGISTSNRSLWALAFSGSGFSR